MAQRAMPSKYDGLGTPARDDTKFDHPDYYFERWDEHAPAPTMARVAERVVYQSIRSGLMQQTLNEWARQDGQTPPEVLSAEEFLRNFGSAEPEDPDPTGEDR